MNLINPYETHNNSISVSSFLLSTAALSRILNLNIDQKKRAVRKSVRSTDFQQGSQYQKERAFYEKQLAIHPPKERVEPHSYSFTSLNNYLEAEKLAEAFSNGHLYETFKSDEKKWYFYLRNKWENGEYPEADTVYLFVYLFELLSNASLKPQENYDRFMELIASYFKQIGPAASNFMQLGLDFCTSYDLRIQYPFDFSSFFGNVYVDEDLINMMIAMFEKTETNFLPFPFIEKLSSFDFDELLDEVYPDEDKVRSFYEQFVLEAARSFKKQKKEFPLRKLCTNKPRKFYAHLLYNPLHPDDSYFEMECKNYLSSKRIRNYYDTLLRTGFNAIRDYIPGWDPFPEDKTDPSLFPLAKQIAASIFKPGAKFERKKLWKDEPEAFNKKIVLDFDAIQNLRSESDEVREALKVEEIPLQTDSIILNDLALNLESGTQTADEGRPGLKPVNSEAERNEYYDLSDLSNLQSPSVSSNNQPDSDVFEAIENIAAHLSKNEIRLLEQLCFKDFKVNKTARREELAGGINLLFEPAFKRDLISTDKKVLQIKSLDHAIAKRIYEQTRKAENKTSESKARKKSEENQTRQNLQFQTAGQLDSGMKNESVKAVPDQKGSGKAERNQKQPDMKTSVQERSAKEGSVNETSTQEAKALDSIHQSGFVPKPAPSNQPGSSLNEEQSRMNDFINALNPLQKDVVRLLIEPKPDAMAEISKIAMSVYSMPDLMMDEINLIFDESFGDILIDACDEIPKIQEEYIEELKSLLF